MGFKLVKRIRRTIDNILKSLRKKKQPVEEQQLISFEDTYWEDSFHIEEDTSSFTSFTQL